MEIDNFEIRISFKVFYQLKTETLGLSLLGFISQFKS